MARRAVAVVAGLAVVVGAAWLAVRALEPDESRIRRAIARFEASIESKSILGFMAGVDDEYRDSGGLDYGTLKGIAYQTFKVFAVLELEITEPEVRIAADRATATAHFNCSLKAAQSPGGEVTDLVGREIGAPLIVLKFVRRGSRWKVVGADYGPGAKPPSEEGGPD